MADSSDAFTQGTEIQEDDPFAGTDFGDLDLSEGSSAAAKADVDQPAAAEEEPLPTSPVAEAPVERPAAQAPQEQPPPAEVPAETAPPAQEVPLKTVNKEGEEIDLPPAVETPAAAEMSEVTPGQTGPHVESLTAATKATDAPGTDAVEVEAPTEKPAEKPAAVDSEPPLAPEPEEVSKGGKVMKRKYLIFAPNGIDSFKRVHWYVNRDGAMCRRGDPGARKQVIALARDNEVALKIGYAAVGAPQDGASLVAVAEASFRVRNVEPDTPQPTRQRLKISG